VKRAFAVAIVVSFALPATTAAGSDESIPVLYRRIAAQYDIAPALFYAVALAESGRSTAPGPVRRLWPWTLNVAGRGRYFATRADAARVLNAVLGMGRRSVDIGLMNWRYHHEKLIYPVLALDPHLNMAVAAGVLRLWRGL